MRSTPAAPQPASDFRQVLWLERLGIRESGHEHFDGCAVIPIVDEHGEVTELYGRKITPGLRKGTPLHLYLLRTPTSTIFITGV